MSDVTGVGTGRRLDTTTDAFFGGPGDDLIYSSQHDRVHAVPGDDRIDANYLKPEDVVPGGPGQDVVIESDEIRGLP